MSADESQVNVQIKSEKGREIFGVRQMDQRVIQFTRAKINEDVVVIMPEFDQEMIPKHI